MCPPLDDDKPTELLTTVTRLRSIVDFAPLELIPAALPDAIELLTLMTAGPLVEEATNPLELLPDFRDLCGKGADFLFFRRREERRRATRNPAPPLEEPHFTGHETESASHRVQLRCLAQCGVPRSARASGRSLDVMDPATSLPSGAGSTRRSPRTSATCLNPCRSTHPRRCPAPWPPGNPPPGQPVRHYRGSNRATPPR
jgi:hypothetical protein